MDLRSGGIKLYAFTPWRGTKSGSHHSLRRSVGCTFLPSPPKSTSGATEGSKVEVPCLAAMPSSYRATTEERLKVLRTPGVLAFVGSERQGTPIQMNRSRVSRQRSEERFRVPYIPSLASDSGCAFAGSLNGMEGILVGQVGEQSVSYRWNCSGDLFLFASKDTTSNRLFRFSPFRPDPSLPRGLSI